MELTLNFPQSTLVIEDLRFFTEVSEELEKHPGYTSYMIVGTRSEG